MYGQNIFGYSYWVIKMVSALDIGIHPAFIALMEFIALIIYFNEHLDLFGLIVVSGALLLTNGILCAALFIIVSYEQREAST